MAKTVSAFRPNIPVFSFSFSDSLRRKLAMLFGLKTFSIEEKSNDENIENAILELKSKKILNV
jgi:pyruvate kinase